MNDALLPLLVALAPAAGAVASPPEASRSQNEESGAAHAFVEMSADPESCYVHQAFRLRLAIGFDAEFSRSSMIQLFRRPMDAPLAVQASWLTELPGAEPVAPVPAANARGMTLAVGDEVLRAVRDEDRLVDGRPYTVLLIERVFRPTRAGALEVPGAALRFAYATEFREDFAAGRVALDRRDAAVFGEPITVSALPLPEADQPASFSGAVGDFTVRASAEPRELEVGESLELTLTIEGDGYLGELEAPRLDGLEGLRLYGQVDDGAPGPRTITYDLAPAATTVRALPPIPFVFFDPGPPAAYRTVSTEAIPVVVHPSSARVRPPGIDNDIDTDAGGPPEASLPQDDPRPESEDESERTLLLGALALGAALLLGLATLRMTRRRGGTGRNPGSAADRERARGAAAAFRARLEAGTDVGEAFTEYLATRLDCSAPAVIGPDLERRLNEHGVPPELATRAAALMDDLVAARFGGAPPADAAQAARALVDALE